MVFKFLQIINIGIKIVLFLIKNTVRAINNIIVTILLFNLIIAQNLEQIEIEFAPFMTFEESKPNATILTRDLQDKCILNMKELICGVTKLYITRKKIL